MRRIAILASLLTIGLAGCATDYREGGPYGGPYYDEPGYVEPGPTVYYGSGPRYYRNDYRPGYRPGHGRPWYGKPGGGPKPGWGGNGPKPGWGGNGPKPGGGDGDRPRRRDYGSGPANNQQGPSDGGHCTGYRGQC